MKKSYLKLALGTATVSLLVVGALQSVSGAGSTTARPATSEPTFSGAGPWQIDNNTATVNRACATAAAQSVSCSDLVLGLDPTKGVSPWANYNGGGVKQTDTFANNVPFAYSPQQIIAAYGFPTTNSSGQLPGTGKTIAIIDAYDAPNIVGDLNYFDAQFGIPQLNTCVPTATSGPCLDKVNETGGSTYPAYDPGWASEISLDVEWAHAIAPGASILLVEANTIGVADVVKAISYASSHAQYISMSFGMSEFSSEKTYDAAFLKTDSYFAAAGDTGLGTNWPSVSPNVISVGGTTLNLNSNGTIASETGWVNGGGGCSTLETASAAQSSYPTYGQVNCAGKRATPDVAADADPNTGVFIYDSSNYYGTTGWFTVGGTSLATPIWAARAADTGSLVNQAYIYGANTIKFNDITQGGNAAGTLPGYDLSTGLGSWNN
jgi:subtilase family serine protease